MITQERLKEVLSYDPESGDFCWKVKVGPIAKIGDKAGSNSYGYRSIRVDKRRYAAHRLAWLYVHGYFPEHQIDHINRVRNDNRISNLREVSQSCNMRNMVGRSPSGVKGVYKRCGNWEAKITVGGRSINLGTFSTKLGAAKARAEAEEKHGFITCDQLSEAKIFVNSQPPEEDSRTKQKRSTQQSGVTGVNWSKDTGKWAASVCKGGKQIYLGLHLTVQEAAAARSNAL
jgi:hypothetical protein